MREFQPQDYGPLLQALVSGDRCRPLDAGHAATTVRASLEQATVEKAFAHAKLVDAEMARCCLAGVWLVHDFLDESHAFSQGVDSPSGSFWHGVMHRREGDFSNAKYWFNRVGRHEALPLIGARVEALARELQSPELGKRIAAGGSYDPRTMVDACQSALRAGGDGEQFCRRVQQAEWESLFDYCYRRAVGS